MPDQVVTKELKVRAYVDAQTGQLKIFEADMDKVKKSIDKATEAAKKQEMQLARQQRMMSNVRDSIISSSSAFGSMGGVLGKMSGQMLQVTNQFEDIEYAQQRAGKSINLMSASVGEATGALSKLGVAGLAVGAAIGGWKIGTWINQLFEMGKPLEHIDKTTGELIVKTDEWGERIALLGKLALPVFAAIAWAAKQAGDAIGGGMGISMKDVMTQTEASKQLSALMARRVANAKTQAATDEFTHQLLLKNKLAQMEAQEEADKKMAESAQQAAEASYKAWVRSCDDTLKKRNELRDAIIANDKAEAAAEEAVIAEEIAANHVWFEEKQQAEETLTNMSLDAAIKRKQDEIDINEEILANERQEMEERKQMWTDFLGFLDGIFGRMLGGAMHSILGITNAFTSGFAAMKSQLSQGWNLLSGQMSGGFSFKNILSGIGAIGSAIGPVIGMVGQLFSALKNLFGHNWGKDVRNLMQMWSGFAGISASLQKTIAEDAKKMGDAGSAMFMHLSDVATELGITEQNWTSYFSAVMYGFDAVNKGFLTQQQLAEGLNAILPQMIDAALQFGGVYLDQLDLIIQKAKEAGVSMQSIAEIIASKIKDLQRQVLEQVDIINKNLTPILENLNERIDRLIEQAFETGGGQAGPLPIDQVENLRQQAAGLASVIASSFNAMIQAGRSLGDAISAIGPNIEQMREILKKLGLTMADVGLGWINQLDNINKKYPEQVALINAVTSSLQAMLTAGIDPGRGGFEAMQRSALDAFAKINADGKVSKAELATIKPLLMALAAASLQYGYALDPATIALLKQAGLWDEINNKPDATKVQQQGIGDLINALNKEPDGLIPTLKRLIDMLNNLDGTTVDTTVNTNYTTSGNPPGGNNEEDHHNWTSMQGLHGIHYVSQPAERVLVHSGEKIVGKDTAVGGITIQAGAIQINGSNMNADQVAQAVIQQIRKGALTSLR